MEGLRAAEALRTVILLPVLTLKSAIKNTRLALLAVHLVCISLAVYTRPADLNDLYAYPPSFSSLSTVRYLAEVGTTLSCCSFLVYQQGSEIRAQGIKGYFKNLVSFLPLAAAKRRREGGELQRSAPAKGFFLLANVMIIACIPCRLLQWISLEEALVVLALPTSWVFLLFFARSQPAPVPPSLYPVSRGIVEGAASDGALRPDDLLHDCG